MKSTELKINFLFVCFSECWQSTALHLEVSDAWSIQFCPRLLYSNHRGGYFCPWLPPRENWHLSWCTWISSTFFTNICVYTTSSPFDIDICVFEISYFSLICSFWCKYLGSYFLVKQTFFTVGKAQVLLKCLLWKKDILLNLLIVDTEKTDNDKQYGLLF